MRQSIVRLLGIVSLVAMGAAAVIVVKLNTVPEGGVRLQLATRPGLPIPAFGCAAAPLAPLHVEDVDGKAVFSSTRRARRWSSCGHLGLARGWSATAPSW